MKKGKEKRGMRQIYARKEKRCSHKIIMQGTNFGVINESTHKLQRRACRSAIKVMVSQRPP